MAGIRNIDMQDINPRVYRAYRFSSCTVTPNSEYQKNQYCYRIMIFTEGGATLQIDGKKIHMEKNDLLYLVPSMPYRILNTDGDFTVINIWFSYSPEDCLAPSQIRTIFDSDFDKALTVPRYCFSDAHCLENYFILKNCFHVCRYIEKAYYCYCSTDPYARIELRCNMLQSLIGIIKESDGKTATKVSETTDLIMKYIRSHITDKISLDMISDEFHYHRNHINRLIKAATGLSAKRYILMEKSRYANQLMQETNLSMTEIANILSFYDYSHLYKTLKEFNLTD